MVSKKLSDYLPGDVREITTGIKSDQIGAKEIAKKVKEVKTDDVLSRLEKLLEQSFWPKEIYPDVPNVAELLGGRAAIVFPHVLREGFLALARLHDAMVARSEIYLDVCIGCKLPFYGYYSGNSFCINCKSGIKNLDKMLDDFVKGKEGQE